MTVAQHLASFIQQSTFERVSVRAAERLKIHVLDALGCGIGALDTPVIQLIRAQTEDFGGAPLCTLIGGGQTAPDRAAFLNGALVRYLDFNDSFLSRGETCHPSDNIGAVLAASEYAKASGRDFLTALAVAYQIHCRLSESAPVRAKGFDHTTQGAYAVAGSVARALQLDATQTANAIGMAGTALNALRVTRTGALSHWKGLAYPHMAFAAVHTAFLAMRGITGPVEVFEGNKGFMDAIAGHFFIDWENEPLDAVLHTILKRYNAEIHSQSALEGVLEIRQQHDLHGDEVDRIEIEIFDVAYNIIGGGEEGDKRIVRTKEEADHSLRYMAAIAMLDGQVMPEQYEFSRIRREDVQRLLQHVDIFPSPEFSLRFPNEMPAKITVSTNDQRRFSIEKRDYLGFRTRPMNWDNVADKFNQLAAPFADDALRRDIIAAVRELETIPITDLTTLLSHVSKEKHHATVVA
jgi:2-methylcitrate dehydratase